MYRILNTVYIYIYIYIYKTMQNKYNMITHNTI